MRNKRFYAILAGLFLEQLIMRNKLIYAFLIGLILACSTLLIGKDNNDQKNAPTVKIKNADSLMPEFFVTAPPFSKGIFPCTDCHDPNEVDYKKRVLTEEHTNIKLNHAEENRWCLDCHDARARNFLHLANGQLVPFTRSYLLCGQCHGTIFRDWKFGIHGKRTGSWNGEKLYRLCVNCHNPHRPRFEQIQPLPPPKKPDTIK